jgi:hypothetical protein
MLYRTLLLTTALAAVTARAETTPLKPLMTEPGPLLADESFRDSMPKTWKGNIGTWEIADGSLRGTEKKEQNHQAVRRRAFAFKNVIIAFSFRLDQSRQISLSVNDAKEHVCRLIINDRGFTVQKDDHDHDGPDKAVVFARIAMPIAKGEWHTALVEINGSEMVAQIDDAKHVGFGGHELLDCQKANFGFTAAGGTAEFRDVKVWEAKPRAEWAATKQTLAAKK